MEHEGPPLETLLHRITETPEEFLEEPRHGDRGRVHVAAVVADLCHRLGLSPTTDDLERFRMQERNELAVVLLLTWLFADDWFRLDSTDTRLLLEALSTAAGELAGTPSRQFLGDPERREEMARLALARLGYRPAGETVAQAQDRLTGLSAAERGRVIAAARAAEKRAREIREALAKKAAEESADKWTRE